jgi:WD40 repeat protein
MLSIPDLESINTLLVPGTSQSPLNNACFSPSGDCIVAHDSLGLIYVFDSLTLEVIATHACVTEEYYDAVLVVPSGISTIEFSADGSKIVVCYPYGIREIPHKLPVFIPDEFRSQQVSDALSNGRGVPDNAKQAISEFLHGASSFI